MDLRKAAFDTKSVHVGGGPDKSTGARAVPIYQTTSYVFQDAAHAERLFALEEEGNIYTRIMNPTLGALEERISALEDGVGALALASGQSAVALSVLNLCRVGDEIVSSTGLYGGTYNLFRHTLPEMGIRVHFSPQGDREHFAPLVGKRTKAFYVESLSNPRLDLPDLEGLAALAGEVGVPLIVDNTLLTPCLHRPLEWGANIVVYSATKYIGGHGTSLGGLIVDGGSFPWQLHRERYPALVEPDPSYHGVSYAEKFGPGAFIARARVKMLRDLGPAMSPFNAFLFLQGLETLSLRMEKHVKNALRIAQFLDHHPAVKWVNYPGLSGNPYFDQAKRQTPRGPGSIVTFGLAGADGADGINRARRFIDALELFSLLANVGDARSLVIHPAGTTHQQLSEEERREAGVTEDLVRLSIGLEDPEDLIADLQAALAAQPGGVER